MACIHCGNNPVNHPLTRWGNNLTLFLAPRNPRSRVQYVFAHIAHAMLRVMITLFSLLGVVRTTPDRSRAVSKRGRVLWEEAHKRGIQMEAYRAFGKVGDSYRARVRGRTIFFAGLPRPKVSESGSEYWLDDKWKLKQELMKHGVPVPSGFVCGSLDEARSAYRRLNSPVVVKPRIGSRGRHTTTHVSSETELERAFACARELCSEVVVEEHLAGAVYRGTVVGGRLVGVLAGEPPRVVGDGTSSICALVEAKNASRRDGVSPVVLGVQHESFLARTGYTPESVVEKGKTVDLLEKIGVSYGGHSAEVTPQTHQDICALLERAARVVDDPLIGFDFIIPDISGAPSLQRWGIIECNSNAFINLHHDPVEGEPVNAASAVWEYVEAHAEDF